MFLVLAGSLLTFHITHVATEVEPHATGVVVYEQTLQGGRAFVRQDVVVEPAKEQKFRNIVRQAYDYSCGSAALTTVLEQFPGPEVEERQIMEGLLQYGEANRIVERRGF